VPPIYTDVTLSVSDHTHLQASGIDTTGNLQYFYHPIWEELRDQYKFNRLILIGQRLPSIRRKVSRILKDCANDKLYVLAAITKVLDRTGLRVGNHVSSVANKTYGVSTLRTKHVQPHDDYLTLEFTGKGGVEIERDIKDSQIANMLEDFYERPGDLLFQYKQADNLKAVSPAQINNFISEISGIDMTAKEFRTWRASALFVRFWLQKGGEDLTLSALLERVSGYICNTPSTLRNSYIHPVLIERKKDDSFFIQDVEISRIQGLRKAEACMMAILAAESATDAKKAV
jgi:DNA topoisomerase-1